MLKYRDINDCSFLFPLMTDEAVFPYVREKSHSVEEYCFIIKRIIEEEGQGELISRTILDERGHPIGAISLYDIQHNFGFLSTWIGKEYFGKGYNQQAKDTFFYELFFSYPIDKIFLKIRKENVRSQKALQKFSYVESAQDIYPNIYEQVNLLAPIYDVFVIHREAYLFHIESTSADAYQMEA